MLSWQHALQSKMMRNFVLVIYLIGAAGGYTAYLRAGRAVPDTVAMSETPGAVAYDDTESESRLDLPHLTPAARSFPPAASLAPRRLAFVPKPDIDPTSDAAPADPELAASEPVPLVAVRSGRVVPVRLASLSRAPETPAFSAFAAAFPADGNPATATAETTSSEDSGAGSADLTRVAPSVADRAITQDDGSLTSEQAARDDRAPSTAQASPFVAHADTASAGHAASDTPAQPSPAASGALAKLPAIASPPMS